MKLKRIFASVAAIAVSGALALSASAAITADTKNPAGNNFTRINIYGDNVPAAESIYIGAIEAVKFTVSNTTNPCDEDPDGTPCGGQCHGAVLMTTAHDHWEENFFCPAATPSVTMELGDFTNEELGYVSVQIANFVDGSDSDFSIEVLGAGGTTLSRGLSAEDYHSDNGGDTPATTAAPASEGTPTETTAAATGDTTAAPPAAPGNNNNTGSGTTTRPSPKTGVGGIAVLGGVAVMAAGAVVISRRKGK